MRHTCWLTWIHVSTCSRHAWRWQRDRKWWHRLSVWAAGAIDRWPSWLFTVKAPSIALLHYVTFNRALAYWNSAPWCTFHTLHILFFLPCSHILVVFSFTVQFYFISLNHTQVITTCFILRRLFFSSRECYSWQDSSLSSFLSYLQHFKYVKREKRTDTRECWLYLTSKLMTQDVNQH